MRISDWSSDVCSSDLAEILPARQPPRHPGHRHPQQQHRGGEHARHQLPAVEADLGERPDQRRDEDERVKPIAFAPPQREQHAARSEEHTSELQSLMRISYAVFCLKKKKQTNMTRDIDQN